MEVKVLYNEKYKTLLKFEMIKKMETSLMFIDWKS